MARASGSEQLFAPVDVSILVFFRILFAVMALRLIWLFYDYDFIHKYFIEPPFNFKYYGFGWVMPWPGNGMYWHFAALAILSLFIGLGLFYRLSMALFCLGFTYVFLLEQARFMNHYYLLCLISLIMVFLPAHRAFSLDALLRPKLRAETVPTWTLWLLRFQVGIVYFFAGVAKLNADWLEGAPIRIMMGRRGITDELMIQFMTYTGMFFDLLIVPLLLWRRTRLFALVAALIFNVSNSHIFLIDIFPWFMLTGTLLFFSPDWPRRLARRVFRMKEQVVTSNPSAPTTLSLSQRLTVAVLGVYVAVQLLLPLRHIAYPGNANWNFDGHRFAWRMLLCVKVPGPPRFRIQFRKDGQTYRRDIPLIEDLGDIHDHWQLSRMLVWPDMILQFAHMQAELYRSQGCEDIEIRALVPVSLNGRRPQLLIDPNVNLADQPRTMAPYPWVQPLTEPLPKQRL